MKIYIAIVMVTACGMNSRHADSFSAQVDATDSVHNSTQTSMWSRILS